MAKLVKKSFVINDEYPCDIIACKGTRKRGKTVTRVSRKPSTTKKICTEEKTDSSRSTQTFVENQSSMTVTSSQSEDVDFYKRCLCQYKTVVPVDDNFLAFMVQDFDVSSGSLKDNYLIVSRRLLNTDKGQKLIYMCSCNLARKRMIENLPVTVHGCLTKDFDSPYHECHHIKVLKQLVDEFDEHNGITKENLMKSGSLSTDTRDHTYDKYAAKIDIYGLESNEHVVCVRMEQCDIVTYSIITIDFNGVKPSLSCSNRKEDNCKHAKAVFTEQCDISKQLIERLNCNIKWRSRYVPVSLSTTKIPFDLTLKKTENTIKNKSEIILQPSAEDCCECLSPWSVTLEDIGSVKIYTRNEILTAKAFRRMCSNADCKIWKEYDGAEDQLLNMGTYFIHHEVLRGYLRQFVTEGTTMSSFYKEWYWQQIDNGNTVFSEEFSYNRFRYAWYNFVALLKIDFKEGFACPECGDCPETVVMDGVSLGVRKSFMPWNDYLKFKTSSAFLDGSTHNTRVFLNNQRTRNLVTKYVNTGLSKEEFTELMTNLNLYQPCLIGLFDIFLADGFVYKCPELYSNLLLCLSSNYPVCGLVHCHPGLLMLLKQISEGIDVSKTPENVILLEQQIPVLSHLLNKIQWKVPVYLRDIIGELAIRAEYPFKDRKVHDIPLCDDSCDCTGIAYFPTLTKICHRGDYVLDDRRKQKDEKSFNCRKRSPTHKTLIPGLFTLSCIHGICYGFQLMEDVESPNVTFSILRTRFHTAPKLVVYDNACNLHNYTLNRDPVFFRDTWFVVDRFHWCNHVGCHLGYNLNMYMQYKDLNTQVAEQRNSTLKKLKSMLSYMNVDNFTNHLKLFLWFRSMVSLSFLKPDLPIEYMSLFKRLSSVYSKLR